MERRPGGLYTTQQRSALEAYYDSLAPGVLKDSQQRLKNLAIETGLSKEQILMWLRNRRTRGAYKGRTVHNVHQVRVLEWLFLHYSHYPSSQLKRKVSDYLEMSYTQLQKWFQTRRQRGSPALLTHHSTDEKAWDQTLKEVRALIEEAVIEEYQDIEGVPAKKRKLSDDDDLSPILKGSPSSPMPNFSSPEFSPAKLPSAGKSLPSIDSLFLQGPHPPPPPSEFRLPSVREIIQQIPAKALTHPAYYFPFSSHQALPLPPANLPRKKSSSHFHFDSDETKIILPPLPPIRQFPRDNMPQFYFMDSYRCFM